MSDQFIDSLIEKQKSLLNRNYQTLHPYILGMTHKILVKSILSPDA